MSASPSPRTTNKPRKPDAAPRGRGAWRGAPNFGPAPGRQFGPASAAFPPLQGTHGPAHHFMLATLVGSPVVLTTRTNQRWEATLTAAATDEGTPGAALRNAKDLNNPSAPVQEHVFVPAQAIASCVPQGTPAQPPPTQQSPAQQPAWAGNNVDEVTFGPTAAGSAPWDQFSANEKMFGVVTSFDEGAYTTTIDRNAPDFKEKERKAEIIAKEIMASTSNNPHVAEERGAIDGSGMNEEDKYSSVIRGQNAYIPPGARRAASAAATQTNGNNASPSPAPGVKSPPAAKSPPPANANATANATTAASTPAAETKSEAPKVAVNGTETTAPAKPGENNLVGSFREFMSNEKQRLAQKKQAIVKSEKEKRMAELVAFSQNFKLNKPIPKDLVPILTKDSEKAKQIVEKSSQDAASTKARQIGGPQVTASTSGTLLKKSPAPSAGATPSGAATGKAPKMIIQAIPPFNPNKLRGPAAAAAAKKDPAKEGQSLSVKPAASGKEREPSPTSAALRLNANAPMFKPGHGASASVSASGGATPSPKPKAAADAPAAPPNPFYGTKTFKKSQMTMLKEEFNPFKFAKVAEAGSVAPAWPYTGRKFLMLFPGPTVPPQPSQPPPPQPQQQPPTQTPQAPQAQPPHPPPPMQQQATPPVPGPYEDDHSRSPYMQMYPYPYPYPGQPPMQPMMQVPPTSAPPGYMQPPYMQPMPYPPHQMAPNQPMYGAPMPGMPHIAYMPPGPYPPGGAPRGSMPPPHGYYHQSPQLGHAVSYPMMMQGPPGAPTPHPYDPQGPPNGPPGPLGVGH